MTPVDFRDFIRQLGGPRRFSNLLLLSTPQCQQYSVRNNIPPIYWEECIEIAREEGITGITPEWFFRLYSERRGKYRRPRK